MPCLGGNNMFSLFSFSPFGREMLSSRGKQRRRCKPRLEVLEDRNLLATWTTVTPLPTPLGELASVLAPGGQIYAIGGIPDLLGVDAVATVTAYNTAAGSWTARAPLNIPRSDHAAAAGKNGSIYAFGGFSLTGIGGTTGSAECYSVTGNKWTIVASLNTPRDFLAGAADSQGRIYAIGGTTIDLDIAAASNVVERYNPSQGIWTAVASMNINRISPAVATG